MPTKSDGPREAGPARCSNRQGDVLLGAGDGVDVLDQDDQGRLGPRRQVDRAHVAVGGGEGGEGGGQPGQLSVEYLWVRPRSGPWALLPGNP